MRRRPAVASLAVLAALAMIVGALWMTRVGDAEPEARPSPPPSIPASVSPSVKPSPPDTVKDPFQSSGFKVASAVKEGDSYVCGNIAVRILEFNPNAEEQVKAVETDVPSLVASRRGRYIGVKLQLSVKGERSIGLRDLDVKLIGEGNRRLGINIEKGTDKLAVNLDGKDQRNPGLLFPDMYLEEGRPMEGWIYFWVEEPFGKATIYFSDPAFRLNDEEIIDYYRIDDPIG